VGHSTAAAPAFMIPQSRRHTIATLVTTQGAGNTASDYTEADLRVDIPEAGTNNSSDRSSGDDSLRVEATGAPSASASLTVRTQVGGYPNGGASWCYSDDGGITWYGQDGMSVLTDCEVSNAPTSTSDGHRLPHMMALPDGTIVKVTERWAGTDGVVVNIRSADTKTAKGTWGGYIDVWSTSTGFSSNRHPSPCLAKVPNGAGAPILRVFSLENHFPASTTSAWLRMDESRDGGATWTRIGRQLIELTTAGASNIYDNLRAVYDEASGNWTLGIHHNATGTHTIKHYVSYDDGRSWTLAETLSTYTGMEAFDLIRVNDRICLFTTSSAATPKLVLLEKNALAATFTEVSLTVTAGTHRSYLCAGVCPDGKIEVWGRNNADPDKLIVWRETSRAVYQSTGRPVLDDTGDGGATLTSALKPHSVCYQQGKAYLTGNLDTVSNDWENSAHVLIFGGWSSVTDEDNLLGGGYPLPYLPYDTPANRGYTTTGAGTDTLKLDALNQLCDEIVTTANERYHERAIAGTTAKAHGIVKVVSGGTIAADDIAVRLYRYDGSANSYGVTLRFSGTQIRMLDTWAGTTLATVTPSTALTAASIEWKVAVSAGTAEGSAWYRLYGSRKWVEIAVDQSLTANASTDNLIRWGHIASGGTATSQWRLVWPYGYDEGLYDGLASGGTGKPSPDLRGHPWTLVPAPTVELIRVRALGGPTTVGDTWSIWTRGRKPVDRILPGTLAYSPRQDYRSGTEGASGVVTLTFDHGTDSTFRLGELIGVGALRCNLATIAYQRWTGAAYSTVGTCDFREVYDTAWSRDGVWVQPTGATLRRLLERNSCEGAILELTALGGGDILAARMTGNVEGQQNTGSSHKQLWFECEATPLSGDWATFATSASSGAAQVRIFWPSGLTIAAQSASTQRYDRVVLTGNPYETFLSVGQLLLGEALMVPLQYWEGWSVEQQVLERVERGRGGYVVANRDAPPIRVTRWPHPQVLVHGERFKTSPAGSVPTTGPSSTIRATLEGIPGLFLSLGRQVGTVFPLTLVPQADMTQDPSSAAYTMTGGLLPERWIYGLLAKGATITGQKGQFRGLGAGHVQDTEIAHVEIS